MSMSLTTIRAHARHLAHNANDPIDYNNAQIDSAIFFLTSDFLEQTRAVKTSATVNMTASTNSADLSGLSGFLPARIERARIVIDSNYTSSDVLEDLTITDAGTVLDAIACNSSTGTPTMMGCSTATTAKFALTPKANGTVTIVYATLQSSWQIGTTGAYSSSTIYYLDDLASSGGAIYRSLTNNNTGNAVSDTAHWVNQETATLVAPANVVSSIDDSLLILILGYGIGPALQWSDPQRGYASEAWKRYEQWRDSKRGIGSISGNIAIRSSLRSR